MTSDLLVRWLRRFWLPWFKHYPWHFRFLNWEIGRHWRTETIYITLHIEWRPLWITSWPHDVRASVEYRFYQ